MECRPEEGQTEPCDDCPYFRIEEPEGRYGLMIALSALVMACVAALFM